MYTQLALFDLDDTQPAPTAPATRSAPAPADDASTVPAGQDSLFDTEGEAEAA